MVYPTLPSNFTNRTDRDGASVFSAPDVEAAIKFVKAESDRGEYQFFRGQENSEWDAVTTFHRVPQAHEDESLRRVSLFINYTREIAKHSGIAYSDDALVAIAQHYGQPTRFLDLTTDPIIAAMFACPPGTKFPNSRATIFLYSESKIRSANNLIRTMSGGENGLEIIQLEVSNLWRLQAQKGLFLWVGIEDSAAFFAPDRIEFPHPQGGFRKSGYVLYPEEKSVLENQLDLFFQMVAAEKTNNEIKLWMGNSIEAKSCSSRDAGVNSTATPRLASAVGMLAPELTEFEVRLHESLRNNIDGINDCALRFLPDNFFSSKLRFRKSELRAHSSWFGDQATAWLRTGVESFEMPYETVGGNFEIDLESFSELPFYYARICDPHTLLFCCRNREKPAQFDLKYDRWRNSPKAYGANTLNHGPTEIEARLSRIAEILYDGLRTSPVSDDILLRSLGHYLSRTRWYLDYFLGDGPSFDSDFGERDIDYLRVEYSVLGGHSRTANVRCSSLLSCVRSDFDEWIEVLGTDAVLRLGFDHLTQLIFPQYLFDFEKFSEMYCTEILPHQAFIGAIMELPNLGLAFNPRHIKVFGLF